MEEERTMERIGVVGAGGVDDGWRRKARRL
jgi:hypothetical protein